ncbi:hypothetical protein KV097_16505 [Mumia sp. zg.B17]|uniref:hypothetical protein n=1 Tax=Mumia sp. zg.B17 TaxID=2855446 RepID=UPI001C6EC39F|nr:hypothetical protein [Mumia sp. zg.B17]MBW9207541.1 hypothetical protein [Mumia sp. zg.B17]
MNAEVDLILERARQAGSADGVQVDALQPTPDFEVLAAQLAVRSADSKTWTHERVILPSDSEWRRLTHLQDPTAYAHATWGEILKRAEWIRTMGPTPDAQTVDVASSAVASAEVLWQHFLDEMPRDVVLEDRGDRLILHDPSGSTRTFVLSPSELRSVIVLDRAYAIQRGSAPPEQASLPAWLVEDLREVFLFDDSPREPYVLLDWNMEFVLSQRPAFPAAPLV